MKNSPSREEHHALIFRRIVDGERFFSHNAFEAFMKYAGDKGFTDEHILTMAASGMSAAQIFAVVDAGAPTLWSPVAQMLRLR